MTEYEFLLQDRITKIQSINQLYDLNNNAYISFSGGKDSTVLHYLIDMALPGNKIPRMFLNTGIEYSDILKFAKEMQKNDERIVIVNSGVNIRKMLDENGYPFKSKEHSEKVSIYQNSGKTDYIKKYLGEIGDRGRFGCPDKLKYQFTPEFTLKISRKCCNILKKNVAQKWSKENNRPITMTGMRKGEGGARAQLQSCTIFNDKDLKKFHPLLPLEETWLDDFIKDQNIKLCKLYYPPYNFERTGCAGCPYNMYLQDELDVMKFLLPVEKKKCEYIWKPVYDEYRRIDYRLKKSDDDFLLL